MENNGSEENGWLKKNGSGSFLERAGPSEEMPLLRSIFGSTFDWFLSHFKKTVAQLITEDTF